MLHIQEFDLFLRMCVCLCIVQELMPHIDFIYVQTNGKLFKSS